MSEQSIQDETLEVLFAGLLRCVKKSFPGTAFACDFLVEKGHRSQYFNKERGKNFLLPQATA
jgi:hypothetical protein